MRVNGGHLSHDDWCPHEKRLGSFLIPPLPPRTTHSRKALGRPSKKAAIRTPGRQPHSKPASGVRPPTSSLKTEGKPGAIREVTEGVGAVSEGTGRPGSWTRDGG